MASNINPNNIDGAYPVAGQDNNSQGFRDNFTNTKVNFQYAATEITDLQNKVILKQALTGTTLDNNMGGSLLFNAQTRQISETRISLGPVSGTQTMNWAAGPYYTLTLGGNVSLAFTNFPAAGTVGRIRVVVTTDSGVGGVPAFTLTLPLSVNRGINTLQGYNSTTGVITFASVGTYEFTFETNDGGTTFLIVDENRNQDPIFLPSTGAVSGSNEIPLNSTTTLFTVSGQTLTLAAGSPGQIKILAANAFSSSQTNVTVTNAAWEGLNRIQFTDKSQACTLLYINNKWFVIGNNGCVIS